MKIQNVDAHVYTFSSWSYLWFCRCSGSYFCDFHTEWSVHDFHSFKPRPFWHRRDSLVRNLRESLGHHGHGDDLWLAALTTKCVVSFRLYRWMGCCNTHGQCQLGFLWTEANSKIANMTYNCWTPVIFSSDKLYHSAYIYQSCATETSLSSFALPVDKDFPRQDGRIMDDMFMKQLHEQSNRRRILKIWNPENSTVTPGNQLNRCGVSCSFQNLLLRWVRIKTMHVLLKKCDHHVFEMWTPCFLSLIWFLIWVFVLIYWLVGQMPHQFGIQMGWSCTHAGGLWFSLLLRSMHLRRSSLEAIWGGWSVKVEECLAMRP